MEKFIEVYYTKECLSHVLMVSSIFEYESDEYYLSLLHDILEDTDIEIDVLENHLNSIEKSYLLKEVICITRTPNETYFEYISRLNKCTNGLCKKVKLGDLTVNLNRKETLTKSLEKRYIKAVYLLSTF